MTSSADEKLIILLQSEWELLEKSTITLQQSVEKCKTIGTKKSYSFEEQESFDSLSSKYNRSSDLFTQKVIRTIWILLHEGFVPFIDMMNMCEKSGIINNATEMISIRDLRNQISHEYIPEAIFDLIPEVISQTEVLIQNIAVCKHFVELRNWIK
jgi:hypothetical protein